MDAKLSYASARQNVIAMNVANADTPGYRSMDVKPLDFQSILRGVETARPIGGLNRTVGSHIMAQGLDGLSGGSEAVSSYEVAPAGNAVDIEEQMLKASKNNSEATLVTGLYAKQLGLMRIAIGASGR